MAKVVGKQGKTEGVIANIKRCFGPTQVCANCESRGGSHNPEINISRGDPNQNNEKTKRCSACHLVAYCSEMCQKEHWFSNHQKMCKVLSGKKKKKWGFLKHGTGVTCKSCDKESDSSSSLDSACNVEMQQGLLLYFYWEKFGYHSEASCACTNEAKWKVKVESLAYPMQCPFTMGEMSGKYLGWIDEELAVLLKYFTTIAGEIKVRTRDNGLFTIMKYLINLRATFWYLLTNEKKSYMSEVLLAVRLRHQATDLFLVDMNEKWECILQNENALEIIDKELAPIKPTFQVWQTFLAHLADFHRRLRWTYFRMFNGDLPPLKLEEFSEFKSLQVFALSRLALPILGSSHVLLPAGSMCCACGLDLSSQAATWHLQSPMYQALWLVQHNGVVTGDDHLGRVMLCRLSMPHIFEDRLNLVSCGSLTCNNTAYKMTVCYYESLARLTINWVFKTHQCNGCLQLCYETHRCSGCRSVRYCSKNCLLEDWRVHELSCKELTKEPEEGDTMNVRKLDGEKRRIFYERCISWLSKVDPVFHFFAHNWTEAKLGVDDIIVTPDKKNKLRLFQKTPSKEEKQKNENKVLRLHEETDSSASESKEEESKEKKVDDVCSSAALTKYENIEFLGDLQKSALDPYNIEMVVIGNKPVTFEESVRRQMTKDLAKRGLEIASMKSISLPMASMTPENLASLGWGGEGETGGASASKLGTLMRIPKGLVKLPTTNEKKKKITTEDMANFMKEAKSKAVSIEEIDIRPKALTPESDSEDDGEALAIIREMLENLPAEARERLFAITERNKDVEDWSQAEYKDLLMQIVPHLPQEQSRILSAMLNDKPRKDITIGIEAVNMVIKVMAKNLVGKHFEIRGMDHLKLNSTLGKVAQVDRGTEEHYSVDIWVELVEEKDKSKINMNYALSTCKLVDISPQVASMVGELCHMGTKFKESNKLLDRPAIIKGMEHAFRWLEDQELRLHHWYKNKHMMNYLKGSSIEVRCMEFPAQPGPGHCDTSEFCHVTASLRALRPACIGDNRVDFTRFGRLMCECREDYVLRRRFRQYINTGMCHDCQVYYLEGFHNNMPEDGKVDDGDVRLGRWFKLVNEYWVNQGAVKREKVEEENNSGDMTKQIMTHEDGEDVHNAAK